MIDALKNPSFECTLTDCKVNHDLVNRLIGANQEQEQPRFWLLYWETKVQCRKHRKKRINKKWAKRYGYVTIPHTIPIKINPDPTDSNTGIIRLDMDVAKEMFKDAINATLVEMNDDPTKVAFVNFDKENEIS